MFPNFLNIFPRTFCANIWSACLAKKTYYLTQQDINIQQNDGAVKLDKWER